MLATTHACADVQVEEMVRVQQAEALMAAVKLLWRVTPGDETDPDIKAAVTAALAREGDDSRKQGTGDDDGQAASVQTMFWPEMELDFWKCVESLLDVESGIVLEGKSDFNTWFVSVMLSRPTVR